MVTVGLIAAQETDIGIIMFISNGNMLRLKKIVRKYCMVSKYVCM